MIDIDEELLLFTRRCLQFHHLWTIYQDLLSGKYIPSVGYRSLENVEADWTLPGEMVPTVMMVLYSFFYSLIEDSDDCLDAFRIWKLKYPEEMVAIDALENQIARLRPDLQVFRNRLGFHGSRSQKHEARGFQLFGNHSGTKMLQAMSVFKSLNSALPLKDLAQRHSSPEELAQARLWLDAIPTRSAELASL
jgi:hypothetical protein